MKGKPPIINGDLQVSVLMPAFNEEATIRKVIENVLAQSMVAQLVIVDDCSTDGTWNVLQNFDKDKRLKLIKLPKNQGKGAAIREAIKHATSEIILIQDADLEYDPNQYSKLVNPIYRGYADVVYGSRFQTSDERRVLYFWHMVGNKFLTLLSNSFTNLNLTDMETCFKAGRRKYFKSLDIRENRFGLEPEITAKFAAMKARMYEVSISYFGRTYEEGKKIKARDGFRAIYCIIKYNRSKEKKATFERFQIKT